MTARFVPMFMFFDGVNLTILNLLDKKVSESYHIALSFLVCLAALLAF